MNFNDGRGNLLSRTVIKFTDNVRFDIDCELIKDQMRTRFNEAKVVPEFVGHGKITELESGRTEDVSFLLKFLGFFRQVVQGRITLPDGVSLKDFDKYVKGKPYVLTFGFDSLEPTEGSHD